MRLADKAYSDILGYIEKRSLQIGERLPAEARLSELLGVSRTVIREALARLESDGLTEARRGAGSFVTRLPSKLLRQHLSVSEMPAVLGTYEVRFALEGEAARLAANRRSAEDMAEMEAKLDALVLALRTNESADVQDLELHRAIMRATGNDAFVQAFDALADDTARVMRAGIDISRVRAEVAIEAMIEEHGAIVEAIRFRDSERAALSMRWHLSQGRIRLMP